MDYLDLSVAGSRRLSFYLAAEEWIARRGTQEDVFFVWQVSPSVIFGRNQLIENEVNVPYCRSHNIQTFRRKSGGGCVYSDWGNLMLSYVTGRGEVAFTFNRYLNMVAFALYKLGVEAKVSGRNDILIGERKVSGNAFYRVAGHDIVHGTLLYDTDMANMTAAITPPGEKLQSHGVDSVRQRIALLKDYIDIDIEQLKRHLRLMLCRGTIEPTPSDIEKIEKIEASYLSDDFILGRNPSYTIAVKQKISGVGSLELRLSVKNNTIKRANLLGDFFITGDIDGLLLQPIVGKQIDEKELTEALPSDLSSVVMNLKRDDFVALAMKARANDEQIQIPS